MPGGGATFSHTPGAPAPLGSAPVPLPTQANPSSTDRLEWHSTGIVADSGAWIRIRVGGGMLLTASEAYRTTFSCGPTDDPCFPENGATFGPLDGGYYLITEVGIQAGEPAPEPE